MLGHITLAQLKRARGDRQGALQILQETEFEARKEEITAFVDEVMAYRVRLQAELGHFDEAVEWAKTIVISPDEKLGYLKEIQAIQLARVFIAIGSLDEALNLLNRIEQSAESGRNISWQIEALVLQSIIWQAKHGTDQANARIAKALRLAIPEDHIQIFLDMGEPMRGLIANFKSGIEKRLRTSQSEDLESLMHYTTKVLMAFPKPDLTTTIATIKNIQSELLEPLSQRELEVLRLVAEGKSNQQIAGILFISTGTVKKHLNNIFGKLGVQSRTQCVARGRELNLL
jgi:LuxR family maltose regulon positive regulatory protein